MGQLEGDEGNLVHKGYWLKDLQNGNGVVVNKREKTEFHGNFKDGKRDGFGVLIDKVCLSSADSKSL